MGKRRTDIDHKSRYDESDNDDDEEQQIEQAELSVEQKANIESRKKLVAKRSKTASNSLAPSPFLFGAKPAEASASEDKPSIFSGFKGFSAFKTTPLVAEKTNSTSFSTSITNSNESSIKFSVCDKKETESKIESPFANGPKLTPTIVETTGPSLSFLNQTKPITQSNIFAKANGEHKKEEEIQEIKKTEESKAINKSITESELKFINELNDLYERCYGANKRVYKLPIDALTQSNDSSDQETKYACLLAELNKHCSKWISKHVEESPLVLLTPVFVDYFNYLILLEKHFFPDSFKKTSEPQKSSDQKLSFFSTSTITNGAKLTINGSNGHKEPEEITIIDDKAKENQDIYDSNKKLPNFTKPSTQPFAPIFLGNNTMENFGSIANETSEKISFFKSSEIKQVETKEIKQTETKEIKELEKPSVFPITTAQTTIPKISFGTPMNEKIEESKKEESTGIKPFFTPFSSSTSASTSVLFNFGSASAINSSSITITPSTNETESKKELLVEKKEQASSLDQSKKFSFTPTGGFFTSFKNKEEETKANFSEEKPKEGQTSIFKSFLNSSTPFSFDSTKLATSTPSITGFLNTDSDKTVTSEVGGEGNDNEPYEPPKPETSDVKEEGAVYEKRMKLYYFNEKEKKFVDRGIGNLFLKPTKTGDSTQLIIRADTKLANILLNVKLSKVFPLAKAGPKDISYVCIPNPPIKDVDENNPCKFLFKVKTEEDANELLDKLNEHKK